MYITVAIKYRSGKVSRRYVLAHDERGYYFDGMHCASFRRKTRNAIEAYAGKHGFDIIDYPSEEMSQDEVSFYQAATEGVKS